MRDYSRSVVLKDRLQTNLLDQGSHHRCLPLFSEYALRERDIHYFGDVWYALICKKFQQLGQDWV